MSRPQGPTQPPCLHFCWRPLATDEEVSLERTRDSSSLVDANPHPPRQGVRREHRGQATCLRQFGPRVSGLP